MKPALLLIDLQREFLERPGLEPPARILISAVETLLHSWRTRRLPVIHVRMTTRPDGSDARLPHWRKFGKSLAPNSPGHDMPESLRPTSGEQVIRKSGFNPFASGELDGALQHIACDTVVLAGLHLHACVRTAAVECLERGLNVFVAQEATGTDDPVHAAATRRWLSDRCVRFEHTGRLIKLCDGSESRELDCLVHRSPRHLDEVLFEVRNPHKDEIHDAVCAAGQAWLNWSALPLAQRIDVIGELERRLQNSMEELARAMAVDIGKPIRQGVEEVRRAVANLRDVARRALMLRESRSEQAGVVRFRPLGPVAVISTWNNPVAIPLGKIAPALVYGNTVLWKPAPAGTRIAETLLEMLRTAGVPGDAVRLVTGDQIAARALAGHEGIRAVTLTGASMAGHALQEICSRRAIRFQAELSGNNAAIVWDDASLSDAATQIAWGAFAFAGQRCTANRRVIVPQDLFEPFLTALSSAAARMKWGDPLQDATEIGPVITAAKRDEVAHSIATAESEGVLQRILRPHQARALEAWVKEGAYAEPWIVTCDVPGHFMVQEETMGPVLVVQRARDFEHAIELCNGVRHGLAASLFSKSPTLRARFLNAAQAGNLKFDSSTAGVDVTLPFGGWRASGVGPPEHGEADAQFYTQLQSVYGLTPDELPDGT